MNVLKMRYTHNNATVAFFIFFHIFFIENDETFLFLTVLISEFSAVTLKNEQFSSFTFTR